VYRVDASGLVTHAKFALLFTPRRWDPALG
jgi:hypothetical protein